MHLMWLTQRYHLTTIIMDGMELVTDAYDWCCISLDTKLLGHIYYQVVGHCHKVKLVKTTKLRREKYYHKMLA